MKAYFRLQLTMINRMIKDAGINLYIGWICLFLGFIGIATLLFTKTIFAKYIVLIIATVFLLKFSEKTRNEFLSTLFKTRDKIKIRIIENSIICAPFLIVLLYKLAYLEALMLTGLSIALSFYVIRTNFSFVMPTFFWKNPFEFIVGFRKTFFLIPFCYFLTGMAIQSNNYNFALLTMFLLIVLSMSYYTKIEDDFYIWIHAQKPKDFLIRKLLIGLKHSTYLLALPFLSTVIFIPQNAFWTFMFFLSALFYLSLGILAKYASFPKEMQVNDAFVLVICLFFPPLIPLAFVFFFRKSTLQLKSILHD